MTYFLVSRSDPESGSTTGGNVPPYNTPETAATSITDALAALQSYAIVMVSSGQYSGTLNFPAAPVMVIAAEPGTAKITAAPGSSGLAFTLGQGRLTIVDGLAIAGCTVAGDGAGVKCEAGSSPTLRNCAISNNAAANGAGLSCKDGSSARFTNCVFEANTAVSSGGGAYVVGSSTPRFEGCMFLDNNAANGGGAAVNGAGGSLLGCVMTGNRAITGSGGAFYGAEAGTEVAHCAMEGNSANQRGGGIYAHASTIAVHDSRVGYNMTDESDGGGIALSASTGAAISRCWIEGNRAADSGGGIWCDNSSPAITSCIIVQNLCVDKGGAIRLKNDSAPQISKCTIADNSSLATGGTGGGLVINGSPVIRNTIIWNNTGPAQVVVATGTPEVRYCCVKNGFSGTGNISADPQLYPSYRMANTSPCIDAGEGDPAAEPLDYDGQSAVDMPGVVNAGSGVDIGGREMVDMDNDGLDDGWEMAVFGSLAATAGTSDTDGDGTTDAIEYQNGMNPLVPDLRMAFEIGDCSDSQNEAYKMSIPHPYGGTLTSGTLAGSTFYGGSTKRTDTVPRGMSFDLAMAHVAHWPSATVPPDYDYLMKAGGLGLRDDDNETPPDPPAPTSMAGQPQWLLGPGYIVYDPDYLLGIFWQDNPTASSPQPNYQHFAGKSARVFTPWLDIRADMNYDNVIDGSDANDAREESPPGLVVATGGWWRRIRLDCQPADLWRGTVILTATKTAGATSNIRVYPASGVATPIIDTAAGPMVASWSLSQTTPQTFGTVGQEFFVEGVTPALAAGEIELKLEYTPPTGADVAPMASGDPVTGAPLCPPDKITITVVGGVDLDIDSENHWGSDYFTTAFRTAAADLIEDQIGKDKSKVIFVNDIDKDADEVPDFMDGWNCPKSQIPALEREISGKRDVNTMDQFVPMILELNIPASLASQVRVKFVYPESRPLTMTVKSDVWPVTQRTPTKIVNKNATVKLVASDEGKIRIWKKDGSQARTVASDYVEKDRTYTLSDLGMSLGTPRTYYVEGINASTVWSDIEIKAMVSTDGGSTWTCEDLVRSTCVKCNFTVEVVTQYYRTKVLGLRTRFTPDYTSPYTRLNGVWDAEKADGTYHKLAGTSDRDDKDLWWHEPDATLGHGFVCFQYEGPNLGDDLSSACASSSYQHKYFWGKTGGGTFTFWDHDPLGHENEQSDLAWWDVCEYKLWNLFSNERLVLRRTYTLHFDRLSALFATFNVPSRYSNFGLHINPANKGWGCLSNVGLAMDDHDVDDARMANCRVTKNMPTTGNKSVWRVVMGTRAAFGDGSSELQNVFNAVKNRCSGVSWGAPVSISGAGTLGGDLHAILQGKLIHDETTFNVPGAIPGWDIVDETDLSLNMATDTLDYFDPGYFPVEFGENPEDVCDMQN